MKKFTSARAKWGIKCAFRPYSLRRMWGQNSRPSFRKVCPNKAWFIVYRARSGFDPPRVFYAAAAPVWIRAAQTFCESIDKVKRAIYNERGVELPYCYGEEESYEKEIGALHGVGDGVVRIVRL